MSNIAMAGGATGSGTVTLLAPSTSTNRTINLPDSNGTILTTATAGVPVNGPAFSAYKSATQSLSAATNTKIVFQAEEFDTNTCFDTSTSRFTPTVAGYYQVVSCLAPLAGSYAGVTIYKNGAAAKAGVQTSGSGDYLYSTSVTALIYCNGSTDYLEIYAYGGLANTLTASASNNFFQAAMVRGA